MHEQEIRYYPLNFDELNKGDTLPPDRLEALTNHKRDTDVYRFAVLALKSRIIRECADRGKHFTVALIKGSLRILTDEEAAVYNARMFRIGDRKRIRSLKRLATVNMAGLTDGQKAEHERNLFVFGKMIQASRSARIKAIAATAHQRSVPGLPDKTQVDV